MDTSLTRIACRLCGDPAINRHDREFGLINWKDPAAMEGKVCAECMRDFLIHVRRSRKSSRSDFSLPINTVTDIEDFNRWIARTIDSLIKHGIGVHRCEVIHGCDRRCHRFAVRKIHGHFACRFHVKPIERSERTGKYLAFDKSKTPAMFKIHDLIQQIML